MASPIYILDKLLPKVGICLVIYFCAHYAIRKLLTRLFPTTYQRPEDEDPNKLTFFIAMIVRGLFGLGVSLPSCIIAARTTPWSLGVEPNTAGQVCVATQSTFWLAELYTVVQFSSELALHHLICLVVLWNVAVAPSYHQIKPFYMFFASQLGDVGTAAMVLLKYVGHTVDSSWPLYIVALFNCLVFIFSKSSIAVYSAGMTFQSPYRVTDWLWAYSTLFYGIYCIYGAYRNLKWVGIIRPATGEHPSGVNILDKFQISAFVLFLGMANFIFVHCKVYTYVFHLNESISPSALRTIWLESVFTNMFTIATSCILAFMWLFIMHRMVGHSDIFLCAWNIDFVLQFLAILCCVGLSSTNNIRGPFTIVENFAPSQMQAAMALVLPAGEAVIRLGLRAGVKEQRAKTEKNVVDGHGEFDTDTHWPEDQAQGNFHLQSTSLNIAVMICVLSIPSLSLVEQARVMLASHAIIKGFSETTLRPRIKAPITTKRHAIFGFMFSNPMAFLVALELILTIRGLSGPFSHRSPTSLFTLSFCCSIVAITVTKLITMAFTSTGVIGRYVRVLVSPVVFSTISILAVQVLLAGEVTRGLDYSLLTDDSIGFQNLRMALLSKCTCVGFIITTFFAVFALATPSSR